MIDHSKPKPVPNTAFPLIYLDKDRVRITRYERNGKKAVLTHVAQASFDTPPISTIEWDVIEGFRLTPPAEFAVAQP